MPNSRSALTLTRKSERVYYLSGVVKPLDFKRLTQTESDPALLAWRDNAIREREELVLAQPGNIRAIRDLVSALSLHQPATPGFGHYADCQRNLVDKFEEKIRTGNILESGKIGEMFPELNSFLESKCSMPSFPVPQLYRGAPGTVNGEIRYCDMRMSLFSNEGVIPKLCHDCYKVQVLPGNLEALMQVYFLFRVIELPRNNNRKCMIEMRQDVIYPYKGYIFCEYEEEAITCMEILEAELHSHEITNVYCRPSHGCSEFGLKYPEFKYSADGAHRSFKGPADWEKKEAEFWSANLDRPTMQTEIDHEGISIQEMIGFRTWIDYAEIIGDDSARIFRDAPNARKPKRFGNRVRVQAKQRNLEMKELAQLIASPS